MCSSALLRLIISVHAPGCANRASGARFSFARDGDTKSRGKFRGATWCRATSRAKRRRRLSHPGKSLERSPGNADISGRPMLRRRCRRELDRERTELLRSDPFLAFLASHERETKAKPIVSRPGTPLRESPPYCTAPERDYTIIFFRDYTFLHARVCRVFGVLMYTLSIIIFARGCITRISLINDDIISVSKIIDCAGGGGQGGRGQERARGVGLRFLRKMRVFFFCTENYVIPNERRNRAFAGSAGCNKDNRYRYPPSLR